MNIPSFHQNDLFNELSKKYDKFEVVYAHAQDRNRINQGWNVENVQHYESKTIGENLNLRTLIIYVFKNRKATHIVNGIWAEKSFLFVIVLLNIFRADFLIYSEAPVPTKKRSFIKKLILIFLIKPLAKLLIIRAIGFLAVSNFAVKYFESLGVNNDKIYRFGYFRNSKTSFKYELINETTQFVFVGQLIERKGVMDLLEAIKIISKSNHLFHLTIIGTGELELLLKGFIIKNQLQNIVTLAGVINSENIINYIEKVDLLILPSVFDGWGMVINEALQCQVPVIASDQCGANELIKHNKSGFIFQHNSVESLTENLEKFLNLSLEERIEMKHFAAKVGKKISIPVISDYLNLCIQDTLNSNFSKPIAPWLND